MRVRNFIKLSAAVHECTRFRTTLDFDHEYLRNGSSKRPAENGVMIFSTFDVNHLVNFGPQSTNEKNDLDL